MLLRNYYLTTCLSICALVGSSIGTVAQTPVALSANGKMVAGLSRNGTIKIWSVRTGRLLRALRGHNMRVNALAFSPDNRTIFTAGGSENSLDSSKDVAEKPRLWSLRTGRVIRAFPSPQSENSSAVYAVAFSPDGRRLALINGPGKTCLWNLRTGKLDRTLNLESDAVPKSLAFSPDSRMLAAGGGAVKVWNVHNGRVLHSLLSSSGYSVTFSPDSKLLAAYARNGVLIWNAKTGQVTRKLPASPAENGIQGGFVAFSGDGKTLSVAANFSPLRLWNTRTWSLKRRVSHAIYWDTLALALSPDGKTLVHGATTLPKDDGTSKVMILIWDASSGKLRRRIAMS